MGSEMDRKQRFHRSPGGMAEVWQEVWPPLAHLTRRGKLAPLIDNKCQVKASCVKMGLGGRWHPPPNPDTQTYEEVADV